MISVKVKLDTIDDVKRFVQTSAQFDLDVDLVSGRYVVDAKSILGIFSLDLSKPIQVDIHAQEAEAFLQAIGAFLA